MLIVYGPALKLYSCISRIFFFPVSQMIEEQRVRDEAEVRKQRAHEESRAQMQRAHEDSQAQLQRARDEAEAKFQKAMEQLIAAQTAHKRQVRLRVCIQIAWTPAG